MAPDRSGARAEAMARLPSTYSLALRLRDAHLPPELMAAPGRRTGGGGAAARPRRRQARGDRRVRRPGCTLLNPHGDGRQAPRDPAPAASRAIDDDGYQTAVSDIASCGSASGEP